MCVCVSSSCVCAVLILSVSLQVESTTVAQQLRVSGLPFGRNPSETGSCLTATAYHIYEKTFHFDTVLKSSKNCAAALGQLLPEYGHLHQQCDTHRMAA